jgi:hypothetical protein
VRISPADRSNEELPDVAKHAGRVRNTRVEPSGHGVGASLGAIVGPDVGLGDGSLVGEGVGSKVGPVVGDVVGLSVGCVVVGSSVGASVHSNTVPQGNTPFQLTVTVPTADVVNARIVIAVPIVIIGALSFGLFVPKPSWVISMPSYSYVPSALIIDNGPPAMYVAVFSSSPTMVLKSIRSIDRALSALASASKSCAF